jgi:hypothetical protein
MPLARTSCPSTGIKHSLIEPANAREAMLEITGAPRTIRAGAVMQTLRLCQCRPS